MNWRLFVALRYLTSKRKEKFISIISLISILGVAIGVGALIIVISVMSGFDDDLKEKIIGTYSHIEVISDYGMKPGPEISDIILNTKHITAISFFLNSQALIRSHESVTGVVVKGVTAKDEMRVTRIGQYIKKGTMDLDGSNIVLGSELAGKLKAGIGDKVHLIAPSMVSPLAPLIGSKPEGKPFKVAGIFTSGMYEYDMNLVYVDIARAQDLVGAGFLVSGAAVKVDEVFNVGSVKERLREQLGFPYIVRTWIDSNRNLLEALKLEKTVMFIILTLIVTVACFNIASTLIMTVLEKTKDIGILKAIGASNLDIMSIFAMQGLVIGALGTSLGSALGILMCWCLKTYKFITLPKDIYYIDRLPVKLEMPDIAVIVISSIIISFVATIYPAYKASRLDPVESLRYE